MDKRQREFLMYSVGVVIVVLFACKSIYNEWKNENKTSNIDLMVANIEQHNSKNYDAYKMIAEASSEEQKKVKSDSKTSNPSNKEKVQELKMFCVCESDGCHKCEEIEDATANMNANRDDVNIKFTKIDMKDGSSQDFISQMEVKYQSLIMIQGWRKKRVKLSTFEHGVNLVSKVENAVDNIQK